MFISILLLYRKYVRFAQHCGWICWQQNAQSLFSRSKIRQCSPYDRSWNRSAEEVLELAPTQIGRTDYASVSAQ
jgi:hypothetical protein